MYRRYIGPGLGYVSPVGYPDFASFQTAAIASYPSCPVPFDPTCENPRDAAIASNLNEWTTNPKSCGVMVCDSGGQPTAAANPAGATSQTGTTGTSSSQGPPFNNVALTPPARTFRFPTATFSSSSRWSAPGGGSASSFYQPIPIQTQTPPDTSALPAISCTSTQTYIPPGGAFTSGPYAGQVTDTGACQDNTPAAPAPSDFLSSIPVWGWGIGALVLVLIASSMGGKR